MPHHFFLVFGRFLGHLISIPNHKMKKKDQKQKQKGQIHLTL